MSRATVLIVDDEEMARDLLVRRFSRQGFAAVSAAGGRAALDAVEAGRVDVVLLDMEMPDMSGLDVLRRLRRRHTAADLPVVMVSGRQDSESIVSALDLGANDYVTKPVDFAVVAARVNALLARRRLELLRRSTDALTGLPNRPALLEWSAHRPDLDRPAAALCLNLDRFRTVNNGLGRADGDRLLVELAGRLRGDVPADQGQIARSHGDDFLCLLHDVGPGEAITCAERLLASVRQPFLLSGRRIVVTASIGIACAGTARHPEPLIERADTALYRAKTLSGDRWEMFVPALQSRAAARLQLEIELQEALAGGEFVLRYEPIVDLRTGAVIGLEALVRWKHPERGELLPAEFIPVAEETRLIVPLGQLVLRMALEQLRAWQALRIVPPDFCVAVNVSARELDDAGFIDAVRQALDDTGLDPRCLKLEITESVLMENSERIQLVFDGVRALGVQIALDDFGTGYSSLSYLQNFAVNTLKIDRSFIQGLSRSEGGEIIRTVVQLGQTLGMDVVAEGVEAGWQLDGLRDLGCTRAQGYLFCRPLTAEAAADAAQGRFPVTQ